MEPIDESRPAFLEGVKAFAIELVPSDRCVEVPMAQSRVEALWRVLVADSSRGISPAPVEIGYGFGDFFTYLLQLAQTEWVHYTDGPNGPNPDRARGELVEAAYYFAKEIHQKLLDSEMSVRIDNHDDPLRPFKDLTEANQARGTEAAFPPVGLGFVRQNVWQNDEEGNLTFLPITTNRIALERLEEFKTRLEVVSISRRLYKTEHDFLGVGNTSLEEGDEVWILAGADVPVVLRPLPDGSYEFHGETYVHGVMNGEALRFPAFELSNIVLK